MCAKLINALTNCLDVSGNFMETEFEVIGWFSPAFPDAVQLFSMFDAWLYA